MQEYKGKLYAFAETGTEGFMWMLDKEPGRFDKSLKPYESLINLEGGGHLTVLNEDGTKLWSGDIKCDYEKNAVPCNPWSKQPQVFGYWCHWFHHDVDAEVWAKWFFDEYRAVLRK
jgi:hypothetical protein